MDVQPMQSPFDNRLKYQSLMLFTDWLFNKVFFEICATLCCELDKSKFH